ESMPFVFQFLMKSFGVLVNAAAAAFLWKKLSPEAALAWLANLALFVNVSVWGQTDAAFGFLILLFFYYLKADRPMLVTAVFVVMCLLKVQGAYFIVPLLVYLFLQRGVRQALGCLFAGGAFGYATYLPFIIAAGDWLLPIKVYLNALSYYASVFSRNAQNVWFVLNKVPVPEWLSAFSVIVVLLSAALTVFIYQRTGNICAGTLCYMFSVFMFSFDQHERYILYTAVILFVLVFLFGEEQFRTQYRLVTLSAFLSQAAVLAVFSLWYQRPFPEYTILIKAVCGAVFCACVIINLWQYVSMWKILFGQIGKPFPLKAQTKRYCRGMSSENGQEND
ncbi:MAG: hypothetical protein ACI4Q4_03085, partial [Oscillospiraceae bacterium]